MTGLSAERAKNEPLTSRRAHLLEEFWTLQKIDIHKPIVGCPNVSKILKTHGNVSKMSKILKVYNKMSLWPHVELIFLKNSLQKIDIHLL